MRDGTNLMDGLTDHSPVLEGQEEWRPVYAKLQSLEAFHRLKLHHRVHEIMEDMLMLMAMEFHTELIQERILKRELFLQEVHLIMNMLFTQKREKLMQEIYLEY